MVAAVWPERPYLVDLVSHFVAHGALAALVLSGGAIALRRWWIGGLALCVALVGAGQVWLSQGVTSGGSGAGEGLPLRVVVYNAKWEGGPRDEAFLEWLREQEADLVCLMSPPWMRIPADSWLDNRYPHRVQPEPGRWWSIWLLSRAPLEFVTLSEDPRVTRRSFVATRSVVATFENETEVFFTGLHPNSPRTLESWRRSLRGTGREGAMLRRFRESRGLPMLAAGDFNSTPTGRLHGVFERASGLRPWTAPIGAGTWPSRAPAWLALPIDRVWMSEEFRVTGWRVGPRFGSDHRPVVVDVVLEGG